MEGYTLEDKAHDQSTELWKNLYLNLIINKKFQRVCHVQSDLDILFLKLTAQIGDRLH